MQRHLIIQILLYKIYAEDINDIITLIQSHLPNKHLPETQASSMISTERKYSYPQ